MPRVYSRKTNKASWNIENMKLALEAVKKNEASIREISRRFHVPFSTLRDRIKAGVAFPPRLGRKATFNKDQEKEIATHCLTLIPDLVERMHVPDLSTIHEKSKASPRKMKSSRGTTSDQPSFSEYFEDSYVSSPDYHIANDPEEDTSNNKAEEEFSSNVSESLNGPYLLKKETHCSTILDQLLRDDTYTDVTLTAEGQSIKAHKVVLSLSSGYFRDVLDKDANARNVVFFKDLKFDHLKNIINFIYTGEATIDAGELESFMNTAQMLEISSLADGYKNLPKVVFKKPTKSSKRSSPSTSSPRKHFKMRASVSHCEEMVVNVLPEIKTEPEDTYDLPASEKDNQFNGNEPEQYMDIEINEHPISETNSIEDYKESSIESTAEISEKEHYVPSPGRCPYCKYKDEKLILSNMMRHLVVDHPSKPAYTCEKCLRVYVNKSLYANHNESCLN